MTRAIAVLGNSGVGKTFFSTHLAMALGYFGEKTLLIGCDQKRDTSRAVTGTSSLSLIEALEQVGFDYDRLDLAEVIVPVNEYVDVMEVGPSPLLVGDYAGVLEEALQVFQKFGIPASYQRMVFDVNDERFDGSHAPLYSYATAAIGLTDDRVESLFVLNRLLRAVLIGSYEMSLPMRVIGGVNNRSLNPQPFEQFAQQTKCIPLVNIPESTDLSCLRRQSKTLFALSKRTGVQEQVVDGMLRVAEMLRQEPFNLFVLSPMADEEVWELEPSQQLPI